MSGTLYIGNKKFTKFKQNEYKAAREVFMYCDYFSQLESKVEITIKFIVDYINENICLLYKDSKIMHNISAYSEFLSILVMYEPNDIIRWID